jgi:hypothetical protein
MEKNNEDPGCINSIKLSMLKFRNDLNFGRKSISAKTITEIIQPQKSTEVSSSRSRIESIYKDVLHIPTKDLAIELTAYFSSLLKDVTTHELIHIAIHDVSIGHIQSLIHEWTRLSYLIPTDIIMKRKDKSERKQSIKYFIKLAYEFIQLNNFHAVFAIIAGLNHSSVQRLKNIWKRKYLYMLNELEQQFSLTNNFNHYRQLLRKQSRSIPYLGLITSDIKHLLERTLVNNDGWIE